MVDHIILYMLPLGLYLNHGTVLCSLFEDELILTFPINGIKPPSKSQEMKAGDPECECKDGLNIGLNERDDDSLMPHGVKQQHKDLKQR